MTKGNPKQTTNESHRVVTNGDIEVSTYLEIAEDYQGEKEEGTKIKRGKELN